MLQKISIIAITKNTVSICVQWDQRLYALHFLVAKLPITIKSSRSAERVYNLQKINQLSSATEALVSITPSYMYRQLMRFRRIETAVLPDLQGYKPPNKRRTIKSLKLYNIANKSNDSHNVELNEQSRKTVHRLVREYLHLQFQNERTNWKDRKRNWCKKRKNVSLWQTHSFPSGKLHLTLAEPDKDKNDIRD